MEARYKRGDVVVLTTDLDILHRNSVASDLAGQQMLIKEVESGRYIALPINNKRFEGGGTWQILPEQIVGLFEIDWEKRVERRCTDAR